MAPVSLVNSAQHLIDTDDGPLQIMISWPLGWGADGATTDDATEVPVVFVLDGNAYFATATDIVRRHEFMSKKKAVVVGVGYPEPGPVFNLERRGWNLTPPAAKGLPQWPVKDADGHDVVGGDGQPQYWRLGGAAHFQATLADVVIPALPTLVPALPFAQMPRVLFGHSFGGLFALYSLFTAPGVFKAYMAASPSIWFNDGALAEHEATFSQGPFSDPSTSLYITSGTGEGEGEGEGKGLLRKQGESDEAFAKRVQMQAAYRMNGNARELAERLRATGKLGDVWRQEFALEDHGSAAVCGLQRGLDKLLGQWWVEA